MKKLGTDARLKKKLQEVLDLNVAENAAMDNANNPSASNPFATMADVEITDITYEELVAALSSSSDGLIPGHYYRITDYTTVHWIVDADGNYVYVSESSESGSSSESSSTESNLELEVVQGETEQLIVLAISENKLASFAYSETHPEDIIQYEALIDNWDDLPQFSDSEGTIPGFTGVITYRVDTLNNLAAPFDWRVVEYANSVKTFGSGCKNITIPKLDSSAINFPHILIGANCTNITFKEDCFNIVIGANSSYNEFGVHCQALTLPILSVYNIFEAGVSDVDYSASGIVEITDGSSIVHKKAGSSVHQLYVDDTSSANAELVLTSDTIGVSITS